MDANFHKRCEMPEPQNVDELVRRYREGAEGTSSNNPNVANRWFDFVHACYKQLRETPEGRAGIMDLMGNSSPQVRLWAASHSLDWSPETARQVRGALRDNEEFPTSFTAEMTFVEFDKGAD